MRSVVPSQSLLVNVDPNAIKLDVKSRQALLAYKDNSMIEVWNLVKLEGSSLSQKDVVNILTGGAYFSSGGQADIEEVKGAKKALDAIKMLASDPVQLNKDYLDFLHSYVKQGNPYRGVRRSLIGITSETVIRMRFGADFIEFPLATDMATIENDIWSLVNLCTNSLEYALNLCCLLTYYQLYTDGNKRVSKLFLNAHLIQQGYRPVSVPARREKEYKSVLEKLFMNADFKPYIDLLIDCQI